ncbi:MAG: cobalt transport protein CbiN [Methanomicrobiales archaeon]|jgi:cobalt/nickel transport protein|nr:cobalt transport protein CbiN [Methanomicrobiales archaeon]
MTTSFFANRSLEIITLVAILLFITLFLITSFGGEHEFRGTDDLGSELVAELTGMTVDEYDPLIPQYEPPSKEIEALLFALQASFGALLLGLIFGYWLGQRKTES